MLPRTQTRPRSLLVQVKLLVSVSLSGHAQTRLSIRRLTELSFSRNNTLTALDAVSFDTLSALGGTAGLDQATTIINAVAHHSSGAIFLGGAFVFSSGSASGSSNIVAFKNGALATLSGSGLNGAVSSLVIEGDQLVVGGAFTDAKAGTEGGKLGGEALYNVVQDSWTPVTAGVNGDVTSVGFINNQIQVTGNFTEVLPASGTGPGASAAGFASWDLKTNMPWVNSGGFVVGSMTFVGNGTSTQYVAGRVSAVRKFGCERIRDTEQRRCRWTCDHSSCRGPGWRRLINILYSDNSDAPQPANISTLAPLGSLTKHSQRCSAARRRHPRKRRCPLPYRQRLPLSLRARSGPTARPQSS